MTLFFADLVREASWGTGAGDLPLGGALPGHRRFADAVPPGARFHYCIAGVTHPGQWETGAGEIGSGGTLVRTPLASSATAAGSGEPERVDFAPGLKTVALTVAADWYAGQEQPPGIGDVAGLEAALDGKAAAAHGHGVGEVTGLEAALDGKAAAAHGHGIGEVTGLQAALDGKAALAGATFAGRITTAAGSVADCGLGIADNNTGIYSSGANAMALVCGGGEVLNLSPTQQVIKTSNTTRLTVTAAAVNMAAGVALQANGMAVVGPRRTGWGAASGTATRTGFDTAGVTTAQLAERVKALLDDLIAHGLIGS